MDVLTPEQRKRNMRAIKSKNTKIEIILAKAMWEAGIRYRKNDRSVKGTPDFVMKGLKIAIFCDSEFFHGKDWDIKKQRIGTNRDFWIKKIEENINHDRVVSEELTAQGWWVIRFWGTDIKKNTKICVDRILLIIKEKKDKCI